MTSLVHRLSTRTRAGRAARQAMHWVRYHYFRSRGTEPNFARFDTASFYLRDSGKRDAHAGRFLYHEDEGAAVCYAFGVDYTADPTVITATSFRAQVDGVRRRASRQPRLVVNIGCGLGMVDAALAYGGVHCVGVDPSPGASEGYAATSRDWIGAEPFAFISARAAEGLAEAARRYGPPDTVIMCESIEHIPSAQFDEYWRLLVPMLRATGGIFVITNGLSEEHFPTIVDGTGWCHIRAVDDALYDRLAADAGSTVVRRRSHLVLQF